MNPFPFEEGDFVWCAFPENENRDIPSRHLHIGYVVVLVAAGAANREHRAVIAYTTSQPWPHDAQRPGVVPFSLDQARALGQQRPFVLHLWRMAHIDLTPAWFPYVSARGAGVVGRASRTLRLELEAKTREVFTRHPDSVDFLGPNRPRPKR